MAAAVLDYFGAVLNSAAKAGSTIRRSVDFGEVIVPNARIERDRDNTDKGVARPGEPASAPRSGETVPGAPKWFSDWVRGMQSVAGGAVDQSGNNMQGAERRDAAKANADQSGLITRVLWGGAGFTLFIVGAIMSRPNQVLALNSAVDTAGNILTAPVKATKGAADTAALFALGGKGSKKSKQAKPPKPPKNPPNDGPDDPGGGGDVNRMRAALMRSADDVRPSPYAFGRVIENDLAKPSPLDIAIPSDPLANVPLGDTGGEIAKEARRNNIPENRILKPGDKPPNQR